MPPFHGCRWDNMRHIGDDLWGSLDSSEVLYIYIYIYIYYIDIYIYILIYVYLYNLEHARFFMTNRHPTVRSNHRNGGSIFQIPAIYIYICIYILYYYIYIHIAI